MTSKGASRRCRAAGRAALAATAACALFGAAEARAAAEPRVALAVATRVNVTRDQSQKITRSFARALERETSVRVIRARREVAPGCLERAACLRRLADRASADQVLLLLIVRLGDRIRVGITWADPGSSETAVRDPVLLDPDRLEAVEPLAPRATSWLSREGSGGRPVGSPALPAAGARGAADAPEGSEPLGVWIAGSVSLAALAGGLAFAYQADRGYASLKEDGCATRACDPARLRRLDRDALLADVFLGTAVAAGAAAAAIHFVFDGRGEPSSPPVSAELKSGGALVTWEAKF